MRSFFDYIPGNSFLHRLNPLSRIFLSFMISIACFSSKSHLFLLLMILLNLVLAALAGILNRGMELLKNLSKFSVFIFVLQVLFVRRGEVLLEMPFNIIITEDGISTAIIIVLRLIGATMPLALMLSITQMNDLSNILVVKLKIPYKYAFAFTTALRFIPIFASEMSAIIEAQVSRGVQLDTKNIFKKTRLILPLCLPLLITSMKKIEGSAISAEIRGFYLRTGESCYRKYFINWNDVGVLLFAVILFISAVFSNNIKL
ncbi:MAG: energy-coupling factor transporter transmembrane protein EcfT [Halanaerobiaceae bacterium]|nr:energy-coupling factor transporter transmembrane protein EcfT [Halanaerobiaceae bacterium]